MTGAPASPIAVIDVGSNSVLLLVVEVGPHGGRAVDEAAVTTRLGAGLGAAGTLDPAAVARTRRAVVELAERARRAGAERLHAFATGAARRARDGAAFAHDLGRAIAAPVDVLTGADEAALAYEAAVHGSGLTSQPLLAVDVGGATTEVTLGRGDQIEWHTSVPLGALALFERFGADEARRAAHVADVLQAAAMPRAPGMVVVGSGGTATTLAAVALGLSRYDPRRVHGYRLARSVVTVLADRVARGDAVGLVEPRRAEILPAGACILAAIVEEVGADSLVVSDHGVRHGYLRRQLLAEGLPADLRALWG